jgi:hypothetical protein
MAGLLALAAAGGAAAQAGTPPAATWPGTRVEAYELAITPAFESGSLSARAVLHLINHGPEPEAEVPILLNRLLRVSAVRGPAGSHLDHDQGVVAFEDLPDLRVNRVRIRLAEPLAPGAATTIDLDYDGELAPYTEVFGYVHDRIDPAFTILRDDAYAYPVVGVPSVRARIHAGLHDFRYTATVVVPAPLVVANGGELLGRETRDGVTRFTYRTIVPSWRMDFAIAPYRVLERDGRRVFYFPQDSVGARRVFDALEATKAMFAEWFGPLHGPQGFAVISVPTEFGAQADATAIIQTANAFADARGLESLYHEVSHLWNVRSRDEWPPRWEEGLATYLQFRMAEIRDGSPPVAERARALSRRVRADVERDTRLGEVPMIDYGRHRMTDASYTVGALLFAALEARLGRADLDRIVGEYFQRYHATGATAQDLVRLSAELSAGASDEVFDVWLLTTRWVDEMPH